MPNITLSIPEETFARMKKHQHIKWSSAIRAIIEQRLDEFEEAERLAQKLNITEKDTIPILRKVDESMGKHARKLLNESYG